MVSHLLLAMAGGAFGAGARYLVGLLALRAFGSAFPVATLTVNVVGSFAMGAVIAWLALRADRDVVVIGTVWSDAQARIFLATGILGGFTTFSAFSLDAVALWERGALVLAVGYVAASVILSVLALVAGLALVRHLSAG